MLGYTRSAGGRGVEEVLTPLLHAMMIDLHRMGSSGHLTDGASAWPSRLRRLWSAVSALVAVAAAAAVLALVSACGGAVDSGEKWPEAPVVLISIDTLRSDRLPAYGYAAGRTPAIDALREDAILFERAYTHAPLTLPAHASVFTGQLPDRHGVRDNLGYSVRATGGPLLQSTLKEAGYVTGATVSAFVLRRDAGLADDFDVYDDAVSFRQGLAEGVASRRGDETLASARAWLSSVAEGSFFLFFHIYEPHAPYEAPDRLAALVESPYDAEVAAADEVVGDLIEELKRVGAYDRAIVLLISDHGEGLGDHGEPEHGILLYREILQVPMLLKLPERVRAGESVAHPVQLIDIYPTLVDILELPGGEGLAGTSLLDESRDRSTEEIYAETFYPRLHFGWSDLASLVRGRYHFIDGPKPELYDLIADPAEERNIVSDSRSVATELRRAIRKYDRELQPPDEVDGETRRKLASLGYLGSTVTTPAGPLANPRDRMPTLEDLWDAQQYQLTGRYEEAVAASRRAVATNPLMLDAWEILGNGLENTGRFTEALDAYQQAIGIAGPKGDLVLSAARMHLELGLIDEGLQGIRSAEGLGVLNTKELGRAGLRLTELGLMEEGIGVLNRSANDNDPESIVALAKGLSEAGRQNEALARLEQALALDPVNAGGLETAGLVYLRLGEWSKARDSSARAVEIEPSRANAWNNLGVAHHLLSQPVEAIEAWRKAVHHDPGQYEALFNIGIKAPEVGDLELARWALRNFIEVAPEEDTAEDIQAARVMLEELGG